MQTNDDIRLLSGIVKWEPPKLQFRISPVEWTHCLEPFSNRDSRLLLTSDFSVLFLNLDVGWPRVKHLSAMPETWVWSLGQEDPLEKEMTTHSKTVAWKIPWMEKPGRLQSMGSQRVGHNWTTSLSLSFSMPLLSSIVSISLSF